MSKNPNQGWNSIGNSTFGCQRGKDGTTYTLAFNLDKKLWELFSLLESKEPLAQFAGYGFLGDPLTIASLLVLENERQKVVQQQFSLKHAQERYQYFKGLLNDD